MIEVKTEKGILSKLQEYRIKELNNMNIKAYVVYSLEEFKLLIKNIIL